MVELEKIRLTQPPEEGEEEEELCDISPPQGESTNNTEMELERDLVDQALNDYFVFLSF